MITATTVSEESGIKVIDPQVENLQKAMDASIVSQRIQEIQSTSLQTLLDRQNELIAQLDKLSELPDMIETERQRAIIEADLASVRAEYVKRQEDIGVLANSLFALYDELGLQSQNAQKETPEDVAKRDAAHQAVLTAQTEVGRTEAELDEAKESWWPIGKEARIEAAKQNAENAQIKLQTAKDAIAIVEEQIIVDARDRVRKASIAQNIALIREHTGKATEILSRDIENTAESIALTRRALESAVQKNVATVRSLDAIRDEIEKLKRDLQREQQALDEIPDKNTAVYAEQQKVCIDIEQTLTTKSGQELQLNSTHIAMVQAIEANKSSLSTLQIQHDTAQVYMAKLTTAEKTAEILGRNIDQISKNMIQETANRSLDQVTDHMTITTVSLGTQIGVASLKDRNDALERHLKFMESIKGIQELGMKAEAVELVRSGKTEQAMRDGYKNLGIDVDMSNLAKAVEGSMSKPAPVEKGGKEVTY
jgi:hypothetical protein